VPHNLGNLFVRLSRWATRQSENFLTEAFAIVLESLRKYEPTTLCRVLKLLADDFLDLEVDQLESMAIETQTTFANGRPDIVIRNARFLVYIEVKEFAGLGDLQLQRYLKQLQSSGVPQVRLVLLSRDFIEHELESTDLVTRRWFHIGESLEGELSFGKISHAESRFLVENFVQFLQSKGLAMQKVDRIDPGTVMSLRSLCAMIDEAVATLRIKSRRVADWAWMGLYLDNGQFGIGVRFENPEIIEMLTAQFPVSIEAGRAALEGELVESEFVKWTQGPCRWRNTLDLSANGGEFYSLSKGEQLKKVEEFIRRSRQVAKSLRDVKNPQRTTTMTDDGEEQALPIC